LTSWVGSPNFWAGRIAGSPIAVVLHTMAGSLASCDAWFTNPASEVSAHYGVGLDGAIHAYVRTSDTAWGNGILEAGNTWPGRARVNPNRLSVSIETEDLGDPGQAVTDEEYGAVRTLVRTVHARHPSIVYLLGHDQIAPHSRAHCPGDRWRASGRFQQLLDDTGLKAVA
jgi:N-acetyl-anhydromuramyl-L-alanine amidase AmpD